MNSARFGSEVHVRLHTPLLRPRTGDDALLRRHRLQRRGNRAETGQLYVHGSGGRRLDGGQGVLRQAWMAGLALLVASIVAGCDGRTKMGGPEEPGREWQSPAGMEFVWIPAGSFVMGSPEGEVGRNADERKHEVRISQGFWMGKYEVTQGEWDLVMGENPSHFMGCGELCPVENVSWQDAEEFVRKLNERESRQAHRYRLPTEAEWEYAARSRTYGARHLELQETAWHGAYGGYGTHPVGRLQPSGAGLHDMLGNVWEWTADWYGEYPSGPVTDPRGPGTGSARVARGGSWLNAARLVRSAYRSRRAPGFRRSYIGFRLVRTE